MLKQLKRALKPLVPQPVLDIRTRWLIGRQRREFARLDAQQTFERIYAKNHWGGESGEFSSGSGSADAITQAYVEMVRAFVRDRSVRSIADLGCGDFRVGRQLVSDGVEYVGVDIVRPLIERNHRLFASPSIRFEHRNLIEDRDLPRADVALLRQVLQHLSNDEIHRVLDNCRHYPYLIVTEHVPVGSSAVPNLDKPHGPDIRLYDGSGVFLELPPFSKSVEHLLETPIEPGQVLRSVLLRRSNAPGSPMTQASRRA